MNADDIGIRLPDLPGLRCEQLTVRHAEAIMALQGEMLAALPKPTWYYPSPAELFAGCCARGESYGFFSGDMLVGFGTLTPWHIRPRDCYAVKVGHDPAHTFDFQDVMVAPAFRRRGVHSALLALFDGLARRREGTAIYCTIAPENTPSVNSFEKAGYRCVKVQPAYEGMLRGYYRKVL